ncbi:MAG: hypothetical protein WKF73_17130, partial [Nocardioidaceae bacterium]
AVESVVAHFVGEIEQVPSTVSAIKVNGERAYKRVRAGEQVELAARPVTVSQLDVREVRRVGVFVDLHLHVECSDRHLRQGARERHRCPPRSGRSPDCAASDSG